MNANKIAIRVLTAAIVISSVGLLIGCALGIPLSMPKPHYNTCNYSTKYNCVSNCGCNWCGAISECMADPHMCVGNTISAGECPVSYDTLYLVVEILILLTIIDIAAVGILIGVLCMTKEKTIIVEC